MEPSFSSHFQPPPRYASIALQLPKLPPEVVHGILGDLSIQKLLQISCGFDVPYIDQCICSHFHLSKIFQLSTFADIKKTFSAYQRVRALNRQDPHPNLQALKVDAARFCEQHKDQLETMVKTIIKVGLLGEMGKYKPFLKVLSLYGSSGIPEPRFWGATSSRELVGIFEELDAAEATLNGTKAKQLRDMAKLVQKYPGMLRTRHNFSQEPIRNEQHIVDTLLITAKKMEQRHIVTGNLQGASIFSSPFLYLCPLNRVLWLFLKTTEKHPPITENAVGGRTCHSYPEAMEVVLRGFSCIYPRQSPGTDERKILEEKPQYGTTKTKYAAPGVQKPRGYDQPSFAGLTPRTYERVNDESLLPAAEKEIEWLTAFLEVCQYMAGMTEEWKRGQTVGAHWKFYYPSLATQNAMHIT